MDVKATRSPQKTTSSTSKKEFFLFLWVIFAHLDTDPQRCFPDKNSDTKAWKNWPEPDALMCESEGGDQLHSVEPGERVRHLQQGGQLCQQARPHHPVQVLLTGKNHKDWEKT